MESGSKTQVSTGTTVGITLIEYLVLIMVAFRQIRTAGLYQRSFYNKLRRSIPYESRSRVATFYIIIDRKNKIWSTESIRIQTPNRQ